MFFIVLTSFFRASMLCMDMRTLADYFSSFGNPIAGLEMHKLAYLAQAHHLVVHGEPLFEDDMVAGPQGPIIPKLYELHREQAYFDPVQQPPRVSDDQDDSISQIWAHYGGLGDLQLLDMINEDYPLVQARQKDPGTPIDLRELQACYALHWTN